MKSTVVLASRMRRMAMLTVLCALFMISLPAFATVTIDFSTGLAGVGGTYTLSGTNATGTNIPIGAVTISGAPANNGVDLVTGTCAGTGPGGPFGCLNFNTAANTISITGGIPALGIANGTTLLTGSFSSFQASANGLTDATGPDTKSAVLLTAVGLPTNTQFAFFGFSLTVNFNPSTGVGQITSTDMRNDTVPEPSSVVLFGTMLFGVGAVVRRRFARNQ